MKKLIIISALTLALLSVLGLSSILLKEPVKPRENAAKNTRDSLRISKSTSTNASNTHTNSEMDLKINLGSDGGGTWKDSLIKSKSVKTSLTEARDSIPFNPKTPSNTLGGRIDKILVDDFFNKPGGEKAATKSINEHSLYLLYDNDIIVFEKAEPGFATEDDFNKYQMGETYADLYMKIIDVVGIKAVAWTKGFYTKNDSQGKEIVTMEIPSSVITWLQNGIGYSVSSRVLTYEQLIPVAESLAKQ